MQRSIDSMEMSDIDGSELWFRTACGEQRRGFRTEMILKQLMSVTFPIQTPIKTSSTKNDVICPLLLSEYSSHSDEVT